MRPDFSQEIATIRDLFPGANGATIPLHAPRFGDEERAYVLECIESTFVSSVGAFVDRAERALADFTGARHAVACVNGTSALHLALRLAGVGPDDLVVTQAFTFVATANAIHYCGAAPAFCDIAEHTRALDPEAVDAFLSRACTRNTAGEPIHTASGRRIAACVPMHTYGFCADMPALQRVCEAHGVPIVEDAAESLGSRIGARHSGTFGQMGAVSFNGNKIVTAGGGGMLLTDDPALARRAKHLTTQAKVPHAWAFRHDEIGFNYRMPNLNAALLCAQMRRLDAILAIKRDLAETYARSLANSQLSLLTDPAGQSSNYWLCAAMTESQEARDAFLDQANAHKIQARPAWDLMVDLPMFAGSVVHGDLPVSRDTQRRLVNLPSSPHHFQEADAHA